jgi:hypothetical protein
MPSKKAKSAFVAALPYACRLWASRLRFSHCPAPGLRGTCHKSNRPRRQRTPSWPVRLMPHASEQSPSAFRIVQLRRLEARDISHAIQKGKERLCGCPALCLSPLGKPPPHFFSPLQYTASDAFDAAYRGEVFDQLQHGKVLVFGFYHEIHVAPEFL